MSNLENKVAVVTGGNSGIGLATAKDLANKGAKVIITGRNKEATEKAVAEIGNGAVGYVSDQSDLNAIDELVANVKSNHSKVDVLFINAGVAFFAPIEQSDESFFDSIVNINFKGAFFTLQKFIPLLGEGSSVINLSSVNANLAMPGSAVYSATKSALNSVTKTAAIELASKGIRVNSINPGPIDTPIFGKVGMPKEALEEFAGAIQKSIPVKRFGDASEVAKLVSFLASDEAAFITGSEYNIDGGISISPAMN